MAIVDNIWLEKSVAHPKQQRQPINATSIFRRNAKRSAGRTIIQNASDDDGVSGPNTPVDPKLMKKNPPKNARHYQMRVGSVCRTGIRPRELSTRTA
ncbi:MAG: hypothetical protein R3C19_11665 [Planctomycetaceae bacterium]